MKIINYVCCILTFVCLMNVAHSEESQNKMEQQFLDVFTTDDESLKMKRPFCNAFTGCGKKRNFHENPTDSQDLEINGSIRLPFSIYKALLRAATRNVNEYQLPGIPQMYLSGRMPLHKRIDIRSSSLE